MKAFIPFAAAIMGILLAACKPAGRAEMLETTTRSSQATAASEVEFAINSSGEASVGEEEAQNPVPMPENLDQDLTESRPPIEADMGEMMEKIAAKNYIGFSFGDKEKLPDEALRIGHEFSFVRSDTNEICIGRVVERAADGTMAILDSVSDVEPGDQATFHPRDYLIILRTPTPPVFAEEPEPLTEEAKVAATTPVVEPNPSPTPKASPPGPTPQRPTEPPTTRIGGLPVVTQSRVTPDAFRAIVAVHREALRKNIGRTLEGSAAGHRGLHAQVNSAAQSHNERTRAIIGKLPSLGTPEPSGGRPRAGGPLDGEFEAMDAYRNYAKQFLNDRARGLWGISQGTLAEAEKKANAGDLEGARNRLQSVRQVTGAIINSHLLPPPNESSDMDTPTRMRTRSLHAGTDLLDAANQFDRDGLVGVADQSREGGGKLLNIALGIARFSGAADIPISLIEMVSGKTPEFDDAGNLTLVEVGLLDRSIATLVVGATVAGTVFTGPGGVAVGTGVSKVLHGTKALISGVVKSQLVRKFLRQAGHALVGCTLLTPVSPPNPFEQLLGVERAHASGPCQTAKELAENAAKDLLKNSDNLLESAKNGKGLFGDLPKVTKESLNPEQLSNLRRFEKKLPAGSNPVSIHSNGTETVFQGVVPGRIPGSKAVYEKVLDSTGKTKAYNKTTYAPDGHIIHIKNKIDGNVIIPE